MNIRLENVSKSFKSVKAVDRLNLKINSGDLVSLLGPSGCGKSTTLSLIAGLEKPTEGNIYFDEKNVNNVEPEKRGIGMVFQSYALYPHMTVLDNIMFPLKMTKLSKKLAREKAMNTGRIMHLEELMQRKPSELSGGQQQRVAIARAIVKEPNILLLDEPLSNLDARLRIELREEIRRLQKDLNITAIFVTHDQEEAMSISDKIILMNNGTCQQYSTPKQMYMNPVNKFAAGFLGNPPMNFLDGVYDFDMKKIIINTSPDTIYLDIDKASKIVNTTKKDIYAGIRPEDLRVNNESFDFKGKIISMQTLGKEVYIKTDIGGSEIVASLPWDNNYEHGDIICFEVKKLHVFEKQ